MYIVQAMLWILERKEHKPKMYILSILKDLDQILAKMANDPFAT
jgi:hypothetical protein